MFRREMVLFFLCTGLVIVSIRYFDQPVAISAAELHLDHGILAAVPLQSPILLAVMIVVVLLRGLSVTRRASLPQWAEVLVRAGTIASLAMAWALCLTEFLLKPLFGRTLPGAFLLDGTYGFNWFHRGDEFGSFPSGHAVQITSVASVFWVVYPRWRVLYAVAVCAVALALILAERHFVSDIISGSMIGVGAGMLMTRLWTARE